MMIDKVQKTKKKQNISVLTYIILYMIFYLNTYWYLSVSFLLSILSILLNKLNRRIIKIKYDRTATTCEVSFFAVGARLRAK